jgi:hypothetical protein
MKRELVIKLIEAIKTNDKLLYEYKEELISKLEQEVE